MKIIFCILVLTLSIPAWAFKVIPMVQEFAPSGREATQTFTLDNTGKEAVAIEIEVTTRASDINGREIRRPSSDFAVYPTQLALKANEKRAVRVTWTQIQMKLNSEKAYRLIFRQLPVNMAQQKKEGTNVQLNFLFEYVASIYVTPSGVTPKLTATSIDVRRPNEIAITLENTGTKHILINDVDVILSDGSASWSIPTAEYERQHVANILAGEKRLIRIARPAILKGHAITLKIKDKNRG